MRKFKTCRSRALAFRSLLIVAGALMLMSAVAPRANAALIAYFNFEDAANGAAPDFTSDVPPGAFSTTIVTNYGAANMTTVPDFAGGLNRAAGDLDNPPNGLHSLGLSRTAANSGAHFDIPLFSAVGIFSNMTVTFATNGNGNGFTGVTLSYSTNGGGTFTAGPSVVLTQSLQLVTLAVPVGANNAPMLVLRIVFTGGQSNGADLQTQVDNIQINGTIVPEPATVVGGLLGVLGLCWFQRRRLRLLLPRLRRA